MQKKSSNKWLIVLLLLAMVAGIAILILTAKPYNLTWIRKHPAEQLQRSFQKTVAALENGMAFQIPASVTNAVKTGSVTLEWGEEDNKQSVIAYPREDSFTLTIPGGTDGDYGLWLQEDAVAVFLPDATGGKAYGFNPQTFKADLKDAPLLEVLGIQYEDAVAFLDAFESQKNQNNKILLDLKNKFGALIKNATVTAAEDSIGATGLEVEVYRLTYTFSPEQLCHALDILYQCAAESALFQESTGDETTKQQFEAEVTEAKRQLIDMNATAIIDFYLHKETQVIVKANCRIDGLQNGKAGSITLSVDFGIDPVISNEYSISLITKDFDNKKSEWKLLYRRSQAHNLPGRTLELTTPQESITIFDLQTNTITGAFSLKLFDRSYCFTGTCESNKGTLRLNITTEDTTKFSIIFTKTATAPTVPNYSNICALTEKELAALLGGSSEDIPVQPDTDPWSEAD